MIFRFSSNKSKVKDIDTAISIVERTVEKAKSDLMSGIKKDELDELLKNNYITQETYNEVLNSIELLETIANLDIDELKQIDTK